MKTKPQTRTDKTAGASQNRAFRVGETFNKGDVLEIAAHHSGKGKGLSYPDMTVLALESGAIGGWDVYDGQLADWTQVSFYGFSVI